MGGYSAAGEPRGSRLKGNVMGRKQLRTGVAMLIAALQLTSVDAAASDAAEERRYGGVHLQVDNDLFAGRERDRDYTGGFSVTMSGRAARDGLLSLNPLLERIDALSSPNSAGVIVRHARQLGLIAFTPADTLSSQPLPNDRPYASLLSVSNGRVRADADGRNAWSSSVTVGVLGLSLAERAHSAIHRQTGSTLPQGYDHQISAGGELTARYTLARHHLWIANPSATFDVKTTLQGSVGYLTETSGAISVRVGRFNTPWWSFAPELTDYQAAPMPAEVNLSQRRELYLFAGVRLKARAYNAFLQGQFRDSTIRYSASEIEPLIGVAWFGVVSQVLDHTQLSYTLNYQTAEVRHGKAARDTLWGGVQLSHSF
jgi:hypothetical protein